MKQSPTVLFSVIYSVKNEKLFRVTLLNPYTFVGEGKSISGVTEVDVRYRWTIETKQCKRV